MTRGFFCVFEGIDGSGKSGALAYVQDHLAADGIDVVATLEPGGTDEGLAVRRLVLTNSPLRWASIGQLLLMNAARAQLAEKVIQPALAAGKVVLCDRFVGSTLAYQGAGHGIAAEQIRALHKIAAGDLWPDLTVLLDVEAEQALARSRGRLIASGSDEGRFEALDLAFHRRVRQSFLNQAAFEPPARHVVIDGSQRQQLVKAAALEAVLAALTRRELRRRRNLASHGL
jgi:dTMP kinase